MAPPEKAGFRGEGRNKTPKRDIMSRENVIFAY